MPWSLCQLTFLSISSRDDRLRLRALRRVVGAGDLASFADAALLSADAPFIVGERAVGAADADGAGWVNGQRLAGCLATRHLAGGCRTQFGSAWVWQILLALVALVVAWLKPRRPARLLLILLAHNYCCWQVLVMPR